MVTRKIKSYVTSDGHMLLVDPGPEHLPLIRRLNPAFQMRMSRPPHDFVPNLSRTRTLRTGLAQKALQETDDEVLWEIHKQGVRGQLPVNEDGSASLLDIKVELARRELLDCRLCGHFCGVNRFLKRGRCGLKSKAFVVDPFLHIGEEAVITPAASLKLFQCALNCQGCQSWELIHQNEAMLEQGLVLDGAIWERCPDFRKAAAIEFVGGNPDESIYPILSALSVLSPELSSKPIVWNTHGYGTKVIYDLLDGAVDVYLPDFKGCDPCVERISKVRGYWGFVTAGSEAMLRQNARVIVRILVLPGHVTCCHSPALEWLAQYRERLWISLMEFIPDYHALGSTELNRQTSEAEMAEVKNIMNSLKLRDVEQEPEEFWKDCFHKP